MTGAHARPQERHSSDSSRIWLVLFCAVFIWLAIVLSAEINRPWINGVDYNGAVWSQAAHNILRAGLAETSGASAGFYFGPLPIPTWGYYLHHPPLLHLAIAGLFALFGEHEWIARLVPIGCSLASLIFLWLLVRSCFGDRAATLSAAVLAALPMELRYGQMVNFEPCVLMLVLGALWCLRRAHISNRAWWKRGALAFVAVGLWVDWAMYLFVIGLCVCWLLRPTSGERRFAWAVLFVSAVSGLLYLLDIRLRQPDAWQNLSATFLVRLGVGKGAVFTETQWITRVADSLVTHFLPIGLLLAAVGGAIIFYRRHRAEWQWLGRACTSIVVMDALFVVVFQNDSYIHHYIAFYLVAPVAIAAGIALDELLALLQRTAAPALLSRMGELAICTIVVAMGTLGWLRADALDRQFQILDYHAEEPPILIPELGRAIRANFSSRTHILCNFLPDYGPQLAYYAQRDILNNLSEYRFWRTYLNDPAQHVGGVVWVTPSASSQNIVAKLPPGTKRFVKIADLTFCLWKRDQPSTNK